MENKREAGELAEKEGRKLKPQDYLYQVHKHKHTKNSCFLFFYFNRFLFLHENMNIQYADIKFNCVMTYQGMSMIVEIQWLLKFMLQTKKVSHRYYEITRGFEFINDMSTITSIAKNKQEQLMFLVHSNKDDSKGVESLAQFLMSYKDEIDLGKVDAKGMNVWHYVFQLDKVRMFKLLLDITNKDDAKKYLSMVCTLYAYVMIGQDKHDNDNKKKQHHIINRKQS